MRGVEKKGGKGGRRAEGWGEVKEGAGGREGLKEVRRRWGQVLPCGRGCSVLL